MLYLLYRMVKVADIMKKILSIEDDTHLREGLNELLTTEGYNVTSVGLAEKANKYIRENSYDLIVLDISLPDGNGLELCRQWRLEGINTPILFLTASDEEYQIVRGLDAGGDDYITKPFRLLELLSRIRALLRRNKKSIYNNKGIYIDFDSFTISKNKKSIYLTPIEFQILKILIDNTGKTLKREQLLNKIWDSGGDFIEDNTLSVHISRLREKIGTDNIRTVRGVGYRWEENL